MTDVAPLLRLFVVVISAGMLAQVIATLTRLPSIIFLLVFGVLLGPHLLGAVDPKTLGPGLEVIVTLSVALILFEGGLSLDLRSLRRVQTGVRRLITTGLIFTFVAATAAVWFLMDLPLPMAALFGSLVTVTGPTVIKPILRRTPVRRDVASLLEGEGILIDPLGAFLAVLCLGFVLGGASHAAEPLTELLVRFGAGFLVGGAFGAFTALLLRHETFHREGLRNLIVLTLCFGSFALAEAFAHESGILAVVVSGLLAQTGMQRHEKDLLEFKDQITRLLVSVLFILLAANLDLPGMLRLGIPGLATVLVVMFLIRPANIWQAVRGSSVSFREFLFLSWTAPRGIIAVAVASLATLKLIRHARALPDNTLEEAALVVQSLVFLTVFLTVALQGTTAGLLARLLRITVEEEGGVVIIGANPLGRHLGTLYRRSGRPVRIIDTNPYHCDLAEREDLHAICGSATDRDVLRTAGVRDAGTLIACTESARVNEMVAQIASVEYDISHPVVAINESEKDSLDPLLEREGCRLAFGRVLPLTAWSGDLGLGTARLDCVTVTKENLPGAPLGQLPFPPKVVPFAVEREKVVIPCTAGLSLQEGDRLHLLHALLPLPLIEKSFGLES